MSNVDQFESVFRAAAKTVYRYEPIVLDKILVVTDLSDAAAESFAGAVRQFLAGSIPTRDDVVWRTIAGKDFSTVADLLDRVAASGPSLICTYRHLQSDAWKWAYSLGEHLDVLTQVATSPVMVFPHPHSDRAAENAMTNLNRVMAMTDHVAGDDRLVNYAVAATEERGTLYLAHIEDDAVFARYMDAISKISEIDTATAAERIKSRLLKDAADYIESCTRILRDAGVLVETVPIIATGHHLTMYRRLVEEHDVDLLVMNTRDEDQVAMHGLAYSLAVEMRSIPLLLL